MLVFEKGRRTKNSSSRDDMLRVTGWRMRQYSKPGTRRDETLVRWLTECTAKTDMVRACVKDGQWTAASKSDALFHNWPDKSRKTAKEVDRKYKTRHRHKKHTIWRSDGHGARQSQMETSNSSLSSFWWKREKERRRGLVTVTIIVIVTLWFKNMQCSWGKR